MSDRRYNGDTMDEDSAAQCGEYDQIGKRKEFLLRCLLVSIPVRGYTLEQSWERKKYACSYTFARRCLASRRYIALLAGVNWRYEQV